MIERHEPKSARSGGCSGITRRSRKRSVSRLSCGAVLFALACTAAGADLVLPPIQADLAGDFTALELAGAPTVHWVFAVQGRVGDVRKATFTAEGADSRLRAEVELDEKAEGSWRIVESHVTLKSWLNNLLTAGTAEISGEGRWEGGKLSGELALKLKGLDLGEIAKFADPQRAYVRSAKGTVEGTVRMRFKGGIPSAGDSQLRLAQGTVAIVTFVPSPGLLTQYVPAQVLQHYPGIEAIEMGRTPLEAKVLRFVFRPEGDRAGRDARLRIEGRPLDPKIIAPIELEVNIVGPLESLIRKAVDSRLKVGTVK